MADQGTEGLLSPFLRRKRITNALPHLRGRVLDYGCGSGSLAAYVPANRYLGYDPDTASVAIARRHFPEHTFVEKFPNDLFSPAETQFDTVVALALIEHLPDPDQWIREIRSYLVPKTGRLVLTTPHRQLEWIHGLGAKVGIFSAHAAEEHETIFDRSMLAELCDKNGFALDSYKRFLGGANQLAVIAPRA